MADKFLSLLEAAPAVAVIMRSKNEEPYASQALVRLFAQNYPNFTLYNVDSGSTDGTLEAIKKHNPNLDNITEIEPADYIPGRVLNNMIALVKEEVIVLLNADCIPQGDAWLTTLLEPLLLNQVDVVTSRQVARPNAYFVVAYDLVRGYGDNNMRKKSHNFFSAAACAFRRQIWEREKFPEEGWGEDFVWAVRSAKRGVRFDIVVDSVVEHSHNYTLKTLYRRERGHGIVHQKMLHENPSVFRQGFACFKHIVRDALYALGKGRPLTIPYNLAYRVIFHWAHYQGKRAGYLKQGFPKEFFRD
ncbi:MAG: glycosyltransferase family 2 protein [Sedimenticola sp.]